MLLEHLRGCESKRVSRHALALVAALAAALAAAVVAPGGVAGGTGLRGLCGAAHGWVQQWGQCKPPAQAQRAWTRRGRGRRASHAPAGTAHAACGRSAAPSGRDSAGRQRRGAPAKRSLHGAPTRSTRCTRTHARSPDRAGEGRQMWFLLSVRPTELARRGPPERAGPPRAPHSNTICRSGSVF